jgi:hypothetical protein
MLRYDAAWLIEQYRDEAPARPGLPYAQIGGAGPYEVVRGEEPFRLRDVLGLMPRQNYDEPVARLVAFDGRTLHIERAAFSDGVKSNYAMDGPGELRETLLGEYGAKLPPLGDARLSNGIGTAVVVIDAAHHPYLPRRAPRQSVFPGGYHCTASGETVWTGALDFDGLFTANICRELEEEVGLTRDDLDWIRPVAFCREFLRAGKPQFFFVAATSLSEAALRERRLAAIERQIAAGRQEILDELLPEITPPMLGLCTLECIANLALI